jgi:hypothetical protein
MTASKILNRKGQKFQLLFMALTSRHSLTFLLSFIFVVTVSAQTIQNVLRPKIERLTNKLRKEDEVHFGYPVGFAGEPETKNKYYKLYSKLKDKATDEELVLLTKDTSECIVAYSFDILWQRKYSNLKDIFLQHQNDTTFFWTAAGCTGMIDRINWFMLARLKPFQKEGIVNFITKEEYDSYCDKFKKEDKDFVCR